VKHVEMDMTDNGFLTKRTQLALAASCVEVTLVQVTDAKVGDVMHTGHKMTEFSSQAALTVDQRQDIKENSRARPRRRGVDLWLSY
jgi:hypothetical protein